MWPFKKQKWQTLSDFVIQKLNIAQVGGRRKPSNQKTNQIVAHTNRIKSAQATSATSNSTNGQ